MESLASYFANSRLSVSTYSYRVAAVHYEIQAGESRAVAADNCIENDRRRSSRRFRFNLQDLPA